MSILQQPVRIGAWDLPNRLVTGAPLNEPDASTFYGGGPEGYTDYPVLEQSGVFQAS